MKFLSDKIINIDCLKYDGNIFNHSSIFSIIDKWKLNKISEYQYQGVATLITYYPELNETHIETLFESLIYSRSATTGSLKSRLFVIPGLKKINYQINSLLPNSKLYFSTKSVKSQRKLLGYIIIFIYFLLIIISIVNIIKVILYIIK